MSDVESIEDLNAFLNDAINENIHHDHDHQHTPDVNEEITSSESNCSYCGISNTECLVRCEMCNKWFCNGKNGNKGSHIITHLVLSKHNRISLHPNGDLGDSTLECYNCGNKNIFLLGFVSAKEENVVVILCRSPCALQKDENWDTQQWQSLIEDRQLLSWIAQSPKEEDLINAPNLNINYEQITKLEQKWRLNKNATLQDLADDEQEEEIHVDPILMRYTDGYQYQRSFAPLVKIEADYDKALKEAKGLNYISIEWSQSLANRILASFYFSSSDTFDLKVNVGDEMILRYDGPELDSPWEGKGYITRLPDARQENYTLEMEHSRNPPPTDINNRFTAEFVWKGIPYERMQDAMKTFALNKNSISEYLYQKLLGIDVPDTFFDLELPSNLSVPGMPKLNPSQFYAVETALKSPLTLIQGPPGTGKTVTSASIVYHLSKLHPNEKILVCAPSNVAVDHLTEKLSKMGLKVVRLLAKNRQDVSNVSSSYSLNEMVESMADNKLKKLINLKKESGELSFQDNNTYFSKMKKLERSIIENADIVCCTCVGADDKNLQNFKFRTVLVDESTQASEPETLIPAVKGCKQIILVGDHQQLGPVILNKKASDAGLRQSLFERMILLGHTPIRLEVQYRMHPCLSEFPSNMFYDGSLQNGITNEDRKVLHSNFPWPIRESPMMFWAVYGREEISVSGTSFLNRVEAMGVERIITRLFKDGVKPSQIGVITPYEGQRSYILQYMQMNASTADKERYEEIEVVSVDAFQGREKDYIILSCVRANSQQLIGFLRDPRRLNVALTRAKYGMMILGNPKALNKDRLWNHLLKFYRSRGCLVEGQIDNLQLSSVQLTRPSNENSRNGKSAYKKASSAMSDASFETSSFVSYEGSTYSNRLNDDSKWPTIENALSSKRGGHVNHPGQGDDQSDRDTIVSYAVEEKPSSKRGNIRADELANNIQKLTQQFGGELTF